MTFIRSATSKSRSQNGRSPYIQHQLGAFRRPRTTRAAFNKIHAFCLTRIQSCLKNLVWRPTVSLARGDGMERMEDGVLINCKDAAALLGISPRTLERYVAEAQIPYIRLPQRGERAPIRFSRSHLRKWLDQHTVKPSPLSRFRGNTHAGEVREDEVPGRLSA